MKKKRSGNVRHRRGTRTRRKPGVATDAIYASSITVYGSPSVVTKTRVMLRVCRCR